MVRFRSLLVTAAMAMTLQGPSPGAAQEDPAAAEWCASHGGTVVERFPARGAASESPVALGAPVRFCEFTRGAGAEPPESRISIRLTTLVSDTPSMAATAYLTKPALPESGGSANPASVYCG